jgi:hypothetical protein
LQLYLLATQRGRDGQGADLIEGSLELLCGLD